MSPNLAPASYQGKRGVGLEIMGGMKEESINAKPGCIFRVFYLIIHKEAHSKLLAEDPFGVPLTVLAHA